MCPTNNPVTATPLINRVDLLFPVAEYQGALHDGSSPQIFDGGRPQQNEYRVQFFFPFHETLADRDVLARAIGVPDESIRHEPAVLPRAVLTSWAGKYRDVVDGGAEDEVEGMAYWVKSRDEEELLRIYETAKQGMAASGQSWVEFITQQDTGE
ncbi:hypothetical protein G3M48_008417 [Beauveria asiatica]|uniref:Uncharacterized protein n=1 Tax=Beauveria asiatica TaxID=1069075 RepID=A0AAW0RKW7_9HYPO